MFGRRYRFRSADDVLAELARYNPAKHFIFFYDDNFTASPSRARQLLQGMIDRKMRFSWSTQVRSDLAKQEGMLDLMRRAGCKVLYIGFESVNPESLKEMKKNQTVEDIRSAIREIRKRKIHIHGMFVFGFDADNAEKTTASVDFAIREKIDSTQFLILTPLPGTELYEKLKLERRILDYEWDTYDAHHVKFMPAAFTPWELQMAQVDAHARFYSLYQLVRRLFRWRIRAFFVGLYAHLQNRRWVKNKREYLKSLRNIT
jgi:radical SAM superfamily enzyme YgiQ (UPF0313 family)